MHLRIQPRGRASQAVGIQHGSPQLFLDVDTQCGRTNRAPVGYVRGIFTSAAKIDRPDIYFQKTRTPNLL